VPIIEALCSNTGGCKMRKSGASLGPWECALPERLSSMAILLAGQAEFRVKTSRAGDDLQLPFPGLELPLLLLFLL
jgi:hypothetical protein